MTKIKRNRGQNSEGENSRPQWGGTWEKLHAAPPTGSSELAYVGEVLPGMFDQEDLYPHLITEVAGIKVAVPPGACGEGFEEEYQVQSFHYQPLPQKELHWGFWARIDRVKLAGEVGPHDWEDPGRIRITERGRLEICCTNPRGMEVWLPIPGYRTRRPAGKAYARWEIFVRSNGRSRCMVRFDGLLFDHWPER